MKRLMRFLTALAMWAVAVNIGYAAAVEPILPDQTDIRFIPYPDKVQVLDKGTEESIFLRPVTHEGEPTGTVYYRILSVAGADKTSPISTNDVEVEYKIIGGDIGEYVPLKLKEELLDENSQLIVRAAVLKADGTWSPEVTAAYNVEVVQYESDSKLEFVAGEPTRFMVGESYEMQLSLTPTAAALATYGNEQVKLVINYDGGIDFAKLEYKFAETDDWTVMEEDEETDLADPRVKNTFRNFAEKGVWLRITMARQKRSDEMT